MTSKSKVYFFFDKVSPPLRGRNKIKKRVELLFKKEKQPLERINYVFCSDEALLIMNRQYLDHDYYTDILTFTLSAGGPITGEVYISVDRARDNARTLGISVESELLRLIFHGALHLCGYRDKSRADQAKMRAKEDYYLSQ